MTTPTACAAAWRGALRPGQCGRMLWARGAGSSRTREPPGAGTTVVGMVDGAAAAARGGPMW
jgi:hypothetical protein